MYVNQRNAIDYIRKHEVFTGSNLRGVWCDYLPFTGYLTDDDLLRKHIVVDTYIVFSYSTPIAAWNYVNGWWINNIKYSASTSRHSALVRQALV